MAGASRFSMQAVVTMVDKLSGPMDRATKSVNRFSSTVNKATGYVKMFAVGMLGVGAGLIAKQFLDFDHAITSASAKFPGLNSNTQEARDTLDQLRKTARLVGRDTQFSADQAAQGLDFLAMAGFDAQQAMKLLPGITDLATVANVDLARATDIASDALGAFGLMTKDSTQLGINFNRVNDVMAATMTRSNTNMEDLFESIKKGGAAFVNAGQSVESFNALAGIMANSGLKGAESGTQLRNVMLRLAGPTAQAAKVMKELGVQTQDEKGNFRDIVDIIEDFQKGLHGMGSAQRSAALSTVFGARSVTGMNILLQEGTDNIRKFREGLEGASGASSEMAAIMRQSLINQIKGLFSALTELGFKFIDAFAKDGGEAIETLTDIARNMGPVFEVIGKILSKIMKIMPWVIGYFVAYKAILFATNGVQKIMMALGWIKYLWMMRAAIMSATGVTSAWTAVQWLLNAAMTANPIGVVIMAIAALVGAGYLLIKNWDKVKEFFSGLWQGIKDNFSAAIDWIVSKFTAVIDWISNKWQAVKGFFGGGDTNVNVNQDGGTVNSGRAPAGANASPNTRGITNTNTTNGRLAIDVNTNGNENVAVKQQGKLPPNMSLAYGRAK